MSDDLPNVPPPPASDQEFLMEDMGRIAKDLEETFSLLLKEQVSELKQMRLFTESVSEKLKKHYQSIFPKKCSGCDRMYPSREDYLRETKALGKGDIFDEDGLQEYRNCPCGSTLVVWTDKDRRDLTPYGVARRRLFDECLEKLKIISNRDEVSLREELREVFRMLSS